MRTTGFLRHPAPVLTAAALVLVALAAAPRQTAAQSSTNFKLSPGSIGSIGGSCGSTNFKWFGESRSASGPGRLSSDTKDIVGGFVGGAFSTQATVSLSTTAGVAASVAFPATPTSSAATAVLDELGAADRAVWNFGQFSTIDSAYIDMASVTLPTVRVGQGYWLITKSAANVSFTGLPAPTATFAIRLALGPGSRPGWNQVGNPFLFAINVSSILVNDGVTTVALTDVANTATERVAKIYSGGGYSNATTINGRTAFWVRRLKTTGTVTLFVRPVPDPAGVPGPSLAKPEGASWAVAITPRQGDRAAEPVMVGAAPVGGRGWNPLCLGRAPAPPGGSLSLHLPEADWGVLSGDYVREFRPAEETMSWDLVASGAETPGDVTLDFAGFDLPAGTRLWLSDREAGWTREVSPGQSLTVAATAGARHFTLVAGGPSLEGSGMPLTDGFRRVYPNPFLDRAGMAFGLTRGGDLQASIYDVAGRRIADLARTGLGPGEHVLVWDGRDRGGSRVAPGIYLVRWQAGRSTGTQRLVKVE